MVKVLHNLKHRVISSILLKFISNSKIPHIISTHIQSTITHIFL